MKKLLPASDADQHDADQHNVEPLLHLFAVNRRDLFKLLGAGLVVGFCARTMVVAQESGRMQDHSVPEDLASWLHIGGDGKVTVFTGKVEMGQNIRTSLTQQVAEELRAPASAIALVMGDTALVPFDMGTFGSRTTPQMGTQLRTVASAARQTLMEMAAERWHTDVKKLIAQDGAVTNPQTGKKVSYGELTRGQKLAKIISDDPPLEPAAQWQIAGTSMHKVDGRAFVTGAHQYTADMQRPEMLYGKVLRPSAFHARLVSFEANGAEKLPGARIVHDGDFIGVAAPDLTGAEQALSMLKAQWNAPKQTSEAELLDYLRNNPEQGESRGFGGRSNHESGSVADGMKSASKTLAQTYSVAYIQHAPLEPVGSPGTELEFAL